MYRESGIRIAVALVFIILLSTSSLAASIQYVYDSVGRLIATVSDTGDVTIYSYDEVGNLLSITKDAFNPVPPVIQSINPDVLFIGATTLVSITGQNLLTTKNVSANDPHLSIAIETVTDSEIALEVTSTSDASPGSVNLALDTLYGTANVQTTLTRSQLSFGPSLLSLLPGSSGNLAATIYPPLGRAETVHIRSNDPTVASAPQAITIPTDGMTLFTVNALREGVADITSGQAASIVFVTNSAFTPISGEQLTIKSRQVSVYLDSPQAAATSASLPISAYIDNPAAGSSLQFLFSVRVDATYANSAIQSLPFSVGIDSPTANSTTVARPVSIFVDSPTNDSTTISNPASARISQ